MTFTIVVELIWSGVELALRFTGAICSEDTTCLNFPQCYTISFGSSLTPKTKKIYFLHALDHPLTMGLLSGAYLVLESLAGCGAMGEFLTQHWPLAGIISLVFWMRFSP